MSDLQRAPFSPVEHCSALYSTGQGIILALPWHTAPCQAADHAVSARPVHVSGYSIPCHVMPCFVMLCHCLPCHGMVYHGMPCQAKPWLYMAWNVMLCIAMYQLLPRVISMVSPSPTTSTSMLYPAMRQSRAWHAMLCHGLPCHAISCAVSSVHFAVSHMPLYLPHLVPHLLVSCPGLPYLA